MQHAQYSKEFKTNDDVEVDYVQMANSVKGAKGIYGGHNADEFKAALKEAYKYDGLSVIHVPVYSGTDELGGMELYGSWNVGNWCEDVQAEYVKQKFNLRKNIMYENLGNFIDGQWSNNTKEKLEVFNLLMKR